MLDEQDRTPTPPELPRLVSTETLAKAWDVTPATVRRWARENFIPAKRVGTLWRFDVRDLQRIVGDGGKR